MVADGGDTGGGAAATLVQEISTDQFLNIAACYESFQEVLMEEAYERAEKVNTTGSMHNNTSFGKEKKRLSISFIFIYHVFGFTDNDFMYREAKFKTSLWVGFFLDVLTFVEKNRDSKILGWKRKIAQNLSASPVKEGGAASP